MSAAPLPDFACQYSIENPVELPPGTKQKIAKVEAASMLERFLCTKKSLLILALCIFSCAVTGCLESTFNLASESRLPRSMTLPPGLTRTDVSVTLSYYTTPLGGVAKFIMRDKKGKKLAEIIGKVKNSYPMYLKNPPKGFGPGYPAYEIVVVNGMTEIIEQRKMEPIFYINDDPAVSKELLAGGAGL